MTDGAGPERLAWIEAARTLACALVVLVHVNIAFRPGVDAWWPNGLYSLPVFTLAVPVFFAIAGFLAERRPPHAGEEAAWLSGRLARLLPPYFAWNALLLATGAQGAGLTPAEVALFFVFGTRHLYFVCALVQLLALHAFLGRRVPGRRLVVLAVTLSVVYYVLADSAAWVTGSGGEILERVLNRLCAGWAVYYAVGAWLARSETGLARVERRLGALAGAAAVLYAVYALEIRAMFLRFGFHPILQFIGTGLPFQLVGALCVLAGFRRLETGALGARVVERLATTGPDTFGIYLSHVSVQLGLFALALAAGYAGTDALEVPVLAVASWVVCRAGLAAARRVAPAAAVLLLGAARRLT